MAIDRRKQWFDGQEVSFGFMTKLFRKRKASIPTATPTIFPAVDKSWRLRGRNPLGKLAQSIALRSLELA
jgi:hypothetical protein